MERSIEVMAKTIDQAIEQALEQLGASYDEVDVEILSEGGFLRKPKVKVTLKSGSGEQKTTTTIDKAAVQEENKKTETKQNPKTETKPVSKIENKQSVKTETKKSDQKAEAGATKNKEEKQIMPKVVKALDGEMPVKFTKTLGFVTEFLALLGSDVTVTSEVTEKSFNLNIDGENVGMIIGKGGEVMNAIQTIVSSIAIANSNGEQRRVYVNVKDYKERREETLKALALKKAEKVKESGRFIKLEPMTARDRAIIHSALQGIEGIRTYSTGKDPYRCLCIAPKREE